MVVASELLLVVSVPLEEEEDEGRLSSAERADIIEGVVVWTSSARVTFDVRMWGVEDGVDGDIGGGDAGAGADSGMVVVWW